MRRAAWLVLAALLARPAAAADLSCAEAAGLAERAAALPSGLLLAIGQVESGRADASGHRAPWPWSVQAGGIDRVFASADDAIAAVAALRAGGVQSIDIGCFQMNLFYHPDAFTDLASGFDPLANAMAAAGFLRSLRGELGDWDAAIAAYHSRNDALGGPYRDLVHAAWRGAAPEFAHVWSVHVWGPGHGAAPGRVFASGRLPRVITPRLSFH